MTGWLVYILQCRDGTLYTGITTDLRRRLAAHDRGVASKYTRARLPVRVIYQEAQRSRSSALGREAVIKSLTHREKLQICSSAACGALRRPKSVFPDRHKAGTSRSRRMPDKV